MSLFRYPLLALLLASSALAQDWAQLQVFAASNQALNSDKRVPGRVVLYGNSITEGWPKFDPAFFRDSPYIARGISGQTTPQMLVRFRQDVLELGPEVVVILAGTNDIAGNTGPMTLQQISGNMISMCELARANGITVIISSVLPASQYPWKPELTPAPDIQTLNEMLKRYADREGLVYLDYHHAMADIKKGLSSDLTYDGVHPNLKGYRVMEKMLIKAVDRALKR